jgi:hypothetical protein
MSLVHLYGYCDGNGLQVSREYRRRFTDRRRLSHSFRYRQNFSFIVIYFSNCMYACIFGTYTGFQSNSIFLIKLKFKSDVVL